MIDHDIWLYIASNSSYVGAFLSDEDALDEAMRQDDDQPWIELVTVQTPEQPHTAPRGHERAADARTPDPDDNDAQAGAYGPEGD